VRADNRALLQPIRSGRVADDQWLVLEGLKPGDRVIVDGFQKFAAGDVVTPIPWQTQSASASTSKGTSSRAVD
jgi:membrane fusion protein, multidrug efflux system